MKARIYSADEHKVSPRSIDSDAVKILYRLSRNGFKAYLVGGGVRDLLLGKEPKDFDIATNATPRQIKSLFSNSRVIGRRFRLVHIFFVGGKIIEVATFRDLSEEPAEVEPDETQQIRGDNTFGTEETDALRRDITFNALFYDATDSSIIDYVGGMEDLKARLVRVIGDPTVRFAEDPVRLLRVVRHAVRSGSTIETSCAEAISKSKKLILDSSPVRVYEELKKDLASGYSVEILRLLFKTEILPLLLPEISESMLAEESAFAQSLGRIDELIVGGENFSIGIIFAVVALFERSGADTAELAHLFESEEDLTNHLDNFFRELMVPRKERERIEGILHLWYDLSSQEIETVGRYSISSRHVEHLADVANLVRVLPASSNDKKIYKLIEHAKNTKPTKRRGGRRRFHSDNRPKTASRHHS